MSLQNRPLQKKQTPNKRLKKSRASHKDGGSKDINSPGKLSLEKLPVDILDLIIDYLSQKALVTCSVLCKTLHGPAVKKLYQKITIVEKSAAEDKLDLATVVNPANYFSILFLENREKFLQTIMTNKNLANLIKALWISEVSEEPFPDISLYLTLVLMNVRLEFFHCAEMYDIRDGLFQSVKSFSTCVIQSSPLPPNLVELRIHHSGPKEEHLHFGELATDLIEDEIYRHLKKLAIVARNCPHHFVKLPENKIISKGRPFWSDFFEVFALWGIELSLTALSIDGEFWDCDGNMTSEIVSAAIETSKLKALDLKYSFGVLAADLNHPELVAHVDGMNAFLSEITKHLPAIEILSINHNLYSTQKELDGLTRILKENIPNQLKLLSINLDDQPIIDSEELKYSILNHQQNLEKLKFTHEPFYFPPEKRQFKGVPALHLLEMKVINRLVEWDRLVPSIFNFDVHRSTIEEDIVNRITDHKQEIKTFLNSDVIYTQAAQKLPMLTEYFIMGLYINMKNRTILNNGVIVCLNN